MAQAWVTSPLRTGGNGPSPSSCSIRPTHDEPQDDEPVAVQLKGIRLERLRDFGDVWLEKYL